MGDEKGVPAASGVGDKEEAAEGGGQTAEDLPARAVSVSGAPGLVADSPSRHGKRRRKRGKW